MKVDLKVKIKVIGASRLNGVSFTRLKAVSKKVNTTAHSDTIRAIREKYGKHISEYRLVLEKEGYIWRETIWDSGINGHHKTLRKAIYSVLWYVDIFIDEDFLYTEYSDFSKYEKQHKNRFSCKHSSYTKTRWGHECPNCGHYIPDK